MHFSNDKVNRESETDANRARGNENSASRQNQCETLDLAQKKFVEDRRFSAFPFRRTQDLSIAIAAIILELGTSYSFKLST